MMLGSKWKASSRGAQLIVGPFIFTVHYSNGASSNGAGGDSTSSRINLVPDANETIPDSSFVKTQEQVSEDDDALQDFFKKMT